jgi:hypothetical protein
MARPAVLVWAAALIASPHTTLGYFACDVKTNMGCYGDNFPPCDGNGEWRVTIEHNSCLGTSPACMWGWCAACMRECLSW